LGIHEEAEEWLREGLVFRGQARYEEALQCFKRGIQLKPNHPEIQFMLGLSFDNGEGVQRDLAMARAWYREAAEQWLKEAQYNLGLLYYGWDDGPGLSQNYGEAANWFRKAAEQGYERARDRLKLLYDLGLVVGQDHPEAVFWYRRAGEQGDKDAQRILGDWYLDGRGVTQDYVEAASWYLRAARQEDLSAQISLAQMFSKALVPMSLYSRFAGGEESCEAMKAYLGFDWTIYRRHGCKEAAAHWFAKAAQLGSEIATSALAELQPLLTLERAKRTLEMSSAAHYNFGCNVEARKRHNENIKDAITVVEDAGYKLKRVGCGYELETIQ
jgi:TPR repeat protein